MPEVLWCSAKAAADRPERAAVQWKARRACSKWRVSTRKAGGNDPKAAVFRAIGPVIGSKIPVADRKASVTGPTSLVPDSKLTVADPKPTVADPKATVSDSKATGTD